MWCDMGLAGHMKTCVPIINMSVCTTKMRIPLAPRTSFSGSSPLEPHTEKFQRPETTFLCAWSQTNQTLTQSPETYFIKKWGRLVQLLTASLQVQILVYANSNPSTSKQLLK